MFTCRRFFLQASQDREQPATPIRFTRKEPESVEDIAPPLDRQAPRIGEHTVEVLKEYGYTDEAIQKYIEEGIVTALRQ